MPNQETSDRSWRRFFRIGIGTLLVLVSILCLWFGLVVNPVLQQRQVVEFVKNSGGTVHFEHEAYRWPLPHPEFSSDLTFDESKEVPGPSWLKYLIGEDLFRKPVMIDLAEKEAGQVNNLRALVKLDDVLWLNLAFNEVTDEGLAPIGEMNQLRVLCLDRNRLTDQGLVHLANLQQLELLDLSMNSRLDGSCLKHVGQLCSLKDLDLQLLPRLDGDALEHLSGHGSLQELMIGQTPLRDEHLRHLSQIPNLWQLGLDRTNITDKGVAYIADNFRLKHLYLEGPKITGECLKSLVRMPTLEYLSLRNTNVTDEEIEEFNKVLPKCFVSN